MSELKQCILCDLDGTLANGAHREHHLAKEPKDWKTYFSLSHLDAPIPHMIRIIRWMRYNCEVFIVSGRSDEVRTQTMAWLLKHGMEFDDDLVLMRKEGDYRPDHVIKLEMLAQIRSRGYEPLMVFDDRNTVVKAWREAGIACAHVADGDF